MTTDGVSMIFLANAGVLIRYHGTTLMVDGCFDCGELPFQQLPEESWQNLLAGQVPFEQVDYLLFTHDHPDHFSAERTRALLQRRRVQGLFLPEKAALTGELADDLRKGAIPTALLSPYADGTIFQLTEDIRVQVLQTRHLDQQFADVPHFCYLISLGKTTVLLTADVDYTTETFERLRGRQLSAAFVNPLFYHELRVRRFFRGELSADRLYVYHTQPKGSPADQMLRRDLQQGYPAGIPLFHTMQCLDNK